MDWKIDNSVPIYAQVIELVKQDIAGGLYPPGNRLPSARDLAIQCKINPNAVKRAFDELVSEGVLMLGADGMCYVNGDGAYGEIVKKTLIDKKLKDFFGDMRKLGISDMELVGYVQNYVKTKAAEVQ